ncbi:ABC transporter permease [Streptomyces albidus (ex Kaewkla and Franco 2022)]|uniref:ABC transporter permease n=1 Tax=Streptomyces albidus (ex Kaewkla and Franco 2022) TaxID=722709 RepID=UPI0015EE7D6B|nr:ABC transporter permease [Streptomyces albidus (ex Kaewkla and Franco 2022)]
MLRFSLARAGHAVVVLLGVTVVVFTLMHLVPGDPVRVALGTQYTPESYEALRSASGLDRPLISQYFHYVGSAFTGDLGVSFRTGEPVTLVLLERLPATLSLAFAAMVIAVVTAFPLGVYAATHQGRISDTIVRVVSQFGVSVPDFWLGILFILLFSSTLGWLPPSGYVPLTEDPVGWLSRVIMPATAVGLVSGAIITRFVRSAVLESLGSEHARTARAKGLRRRIVRSRHVVRNAMVPIITVIGVQAAILMGGVIVIEVVFAWPGLGRLTFDAVSARDYPVVQGAVLLVATLFLLVSMAVDLLYARIDPRISIR